MPPGEAPNVFGPSVTVDCGEFDAKLKPGGVSPFLREQKVEVALAIGVGNVTINDAVVDDIAPIIAAEPDQSPFNPIALAIDARA